MVPARFQADSFVGAGARASYGLIDRRDDSKLKCGVLYCLWR